VGRWYEEHRRPQRGIASVWNAAMRDDPDHPPGRRTSFRTALNQRERGTLRQDVTRRGLHFPESMARRLVLEGELLGHQGCVNRLAWNASGSMLASASDDRQVMLWKYPDSRQLPLQVETEHQGNIFGVRFLPNCGDRQIVTGAMDQLVQLHTLESKPSRPTPRSTAAPTGADGRGAGMALLRDIEVPPTVTVASSTKSFACHRGRVKDVEVEPNNPFLFWSASEDGTVRQFDTRCSNQDTYNSKNVLLGVRKRTRAVQLKGLCINKARPYMMAVACSDPYVRIFDMRKLSTGAPADDLCSKAVLELAPPHLYQKSAGLHTRSGQPHTTHVTFSNRGDRVLATYHSDHAYAFDALGAGPDAYRSAFWTSHRSSTSPNSDAEAKLQRCKFKGNGAMFEHEFSLAITNYTEGLRYNPGSTALLAGRASAYMQRKWEGDASYALLDCERILSIDAMSARAHLLRCQALLAMHLLIAASKAADMFARLFPDRNDEMTRVRKMIDQKMAESEKARAHRKSTRTRKEEMRKRRQERAQRREMRLAQHGEVEGEDGSDLLDTTEAMADAATIQAMDTDESDEPLSDSGSSDLESEGGRFRSLILESGASTSNGKGESIPNVWNVTPGGQRLCQRYIGQCNVQTDIKECAFLGDNDELVACGSDDGRVFIYNAESGQPVRILDADEDVANCVQCHPNQTVLATGGIESVVKLWSPGALEHESDMMTFVSLNQERMKDGPHYYHQSALHTAMRAHVLQTLTENPELIPELRSLLTTQSGGSRMGMLPENLEVDDSNVNCRMS